MKFLAALVVGCFWVGPASASQVRVQQGVLRGKAFTSIRGKNHFLGFLGIPYAKPPVGHLRFKAPEPAEPWTDVRDATSEGSVCAQRNDFTKALTGQDDCLFLNVYTSKLPLGHVAEDVLRPVMFLIHGGGFYFGSGGSRVFGADYLVDAGVVLVTLNYRLGPQGFLSLENEEAPGNAGLKDQVMALRWVRDNIKQFGGDPDDVTIFGQSAGGASVQFHLLSPMSKGLFHKAIAQSGSVLNPWSFRNSSVDLAFRLGALLGLNTDDVRELGAFLRGVDSMELTRAAHDVLTPEEKPMVFGFPFLPTADVEAPPGNVFLPAHPRQLLTFGDLNDVPLIAGVTSHEGILAINILNEHPDALETLDKEFERAVPLDLPVVRKTDDERRAASEIRKFYFGEKRLSSSQDTMLHFIDLITDEWFLKDIDASVSQLAERLRHPVFYYQFSFSGEFGIIKRLLGAQDYPGAAHADELGYLFRMLLTSRLDLSPDDPTSVTLSRMVKMWTNFAKTGNPTPDDDPLLNVTWPIFTTKDGGGAYLDIDRDLSVHKDLHKERLQFWRGLYDAFKNKQK